MNRLVTAYNLPDYTALQREYAKEMSDAMPLEKTTLYFKGLLAANGKIRSVGSPQPISPSQALFVVVFERSVQNIKLYLNGQDQVLGFLLTKYEPGTAARAPSTPATAVLPDRQETLLWLPMRGPVRVSSTGQGTDARGVQSVLSQPFSFDLTCVNEKGNDRLRDGNANEDFVGYSKEVLAPADGAVTSVIDGVPDNSFETGPNPDAAIGNSVTLRHSAREYSVMGFLKRGSILVVVGDSVRRGQSLALCGNSGNTARPALHYHLQDGPYLQTARVLKPVFERVRIRTAQGWVEGMKHVPLPGEILNRE